MILDCLRYWASEYHIDGFRFDLASILGRDQAGAPMDSPPLLENLAFDPVLGKCKLIAEAWDAGGMYQVGTFPSWGRWCEWNGKYRDDVRRFLKGDPGMTWVTAQSMQGSPHVYDPLSRGNCASVNFITAHDGFTLNDLVSYNDKHNDANGESNRDGHSNNLSWNHGVEGPTDDAGIRSLRIRQMRNMLATLLLSRGTPMILAGDEFARTQNGNNNAYGQDNDISWLDWEGIDSDGWSVRDFTQHLIEIRQRQPLFHRGRFLTGSFNEELEVKDVTWFDPSGSEMQSEQWHDGNAKCVQMLLDGRAQATGIRKKGSDLTLLLMFNAHHASVEFTFPEVSGRVWKLLVETSDIDRQHPHLEFAATHELEGRSLALWEIRSLS
jgi:glycogen operon protein